jgi:glycosyltransferase involved in cell wall biosynthesis
MSAWDELTQRQALGIPLLIAGAGDLERDVTAWAAGRPDVRFLGMRSRDECARLLARARAVVAPSEWPEAFGLVVVEAMAAGVPAVAAAHGAFVELIADGESGLFHEPGDVASLAQALRAGADPEISIRLGAGARRRYLAGFTPQIAVERLLGGYRSVLAGEPAVSV